MNEDKQTYSMLMSFDKDFLCEMLIENKKYLDMTVISNLENGKVKFTFKTEPKMDAITKDIKTKLTKILNEL